MSVLGNTTTTTSFADRAADVIGGGVFVAEATGSLDNPWVLCSVDAGGAALWKVCLYSMSGVDPDALLGVTTAVSTAAGSTRNWRQAVWTALPSVVASTSYALVALTDNAYLNFYRTTTGGTGVFGNDVAGYPTPDDPFPTTHTHNTSLYRIYATILGNVAPNAPVITSPTTGGSFEILNPLTFTWTFSDPNPSDTQSAFRPSWKKHDAAAWSTGSWFISPNPTHTYPGSSFDADDWEFRFEVKDALGLASVPSASITLTGGTAPDIPVITDPTPGANITSTPYNVDWTCPDQAQGYQVRTVRRTPGGIPDPATVYQDTGLVADAVARTASITFATNLRYEYVQVRVKNGGVLCDWASNVCWVQWLAPATPTVEVIANSTAGYISVQATHPAPAGGQPTVTSEDIYRSEYADGSGAIRIATLRTPGALYYDYTVASGRDYFYQVRAIAGTTADSVWTG